MSKLKLACEAQSLYAQVSRKNKLPLGWRGGGTKGASDGAFPSSQAHICSLIKDFDVGNVKGGLQAKIVELLKAHIPNEFPRIFRHRFRDLGMDQAAVQSFISPAICTTTRSSPWLLVIL